MKPSSLLEQIQKKRSYLCVGLDSDASKIPGHLGRSVSGILQFNQAIIEATAPFAVAYKINTAFYEQYGSDGWAVMEDTLEMIPDDCFTIADAKRGDIGNTGNMYARAFLETLDFNSITVSPYMGEDSVKPFIRDDKVAIVLGLTSNSGSSDFQYLKSDGKYLFEHVISKAATWGTDDQIMFVVGATRADMLKDIRKLIPNHYILVPGVGSQGGNLADVSNFGMNKRCGLLVNSSRGIIYASDGTDFAQAAAIEARKLRDEMDHYLKLKNL